MKQINIPGKPGCIVHLSVYLNHRAQTITHLLYDRLRRLPESARTGWGPIYR